MDSHLFFLAAQQTPILQLLAGAERYVRKHALPVEMLPVRSVEAWRIDKHLRSQHKPAAIVGMLDNNKIDHFRSTLPSVHLLSALSVCDHPEATVIHADDTLIGRQAVDHLQAMGYQHLATFGKWSVPLRKRRFTAAHERCKELGISLHGLERPQHITNQDDGDAWLLAALEGLPKPLGIITHQDVDAAFLRSFCLANNLHAPSDVGILGVGNTLNLCEKIRPTLSSIRVPWMHIGEAIAHTWHGMLNGGTPAQSRAIATYGVHTRQSTDLSQHQITDPLVKKFLALLRKKAHRTISLPDYANELGVSRTTLHRRVTAALTCSPQELLHNQRISRACDLLLNTDLDLNAIARRCGYASPQLLHRAFTARFPVPPGIWRSG